jgi:hypothetical protein
MIKLVRCALIAAACVGLSMTCIAVVRAYAPPPLPQSFYGTVEVRGTPAPVGTMVEARGQGVKLPAPNNPISVTVAGLYGGASAFNPKLVVQGNLTEGQPLRFYVDHIAAKCAPPGQNWQETCPFSSGVITNLNLSAGYAIWLPSLMRN